MLLFGAVGNEEISNRMLSKHMLTAPKLPSPGLLEIPDVAKNEKDGY